MDQAKQSLLAKELLELEEKKTLLEKEKKLLLGNFLAHILPPGSNSYLAKSPLSSLTPKRIPDNPDEIKHFLISEQEKLKTCFGKLQELLLLRKKFRLPENTTIERNLLNVMTHFRHNQQIKVAIECVIREEVFNRDDAKNEKYMNMYFKYYSQQLALDIWIKQINDSLLIPNNDVKVRKIFDDMIADAKKTAEKFSAIQKTLLKNEQVAKKEIKQPNEEEVKKCRKEYTEAFCNTMQRINQRKDGAQGMWYYNEYFYFCKKQGYLVPEIKEYQSYRGLNATYWRRLSNTYEYYKQGNKYDYVLKQGINPSVAIKDLQTSFSIIECATMIQVVVYMTILDLVGDEVFDIYFKHLSRNLFGIGRFSDARYAANSFYKKITLSTIGTMGNRSLEGGDWCYIKNIEDYLKKHPKGTARGYNVIYCGKNKVGEDLFEAAGSKSDDGALEKLLQQKNELKLDLNAKNKQGDTSLHIAVRAGNKNTCLLLLKYGANPKLGDATLKPVLEVAFGLKMAFATETQEGKQFSNLYMELMSALQPKPKPALNLSSQ